MRSRKKLLHKDRKVDCKRREATKEQAKVITLPEQSRLKKVMKTMGRKGKNHKLKVR